MLCARRERFEMKLPLGIGQSRRGLAAVTVAEYDCIAYRLAVGADDSAVETFNGVVQRDPPSVVCFSRSSLDCLEKSTAFSSAPRSRFLEVAAHK
jgi:hypothetical protein